LITINLLGGAKKAVGTSLVILEKPTASISDILKLLGSQAKDSRIFNSNNLLIAINGVESSVLSGNDTLVQTGDKVTIVPVVHGGT